MAISPNAYTYRVVEHDGRAIGCGSSWKETRVYIERVADAKLVREVGPTNCKWANQVRAKANDLCRRMNESAAS